jgi:8-oxo-dGTP diphosphatase
MDESKLHVIAVNGMIHKDGKFLIVKRSENEIGYPGKWQIPGGKLESKETLQQSLEREILEEVNLKIKNIRYLTDFEFTRPDSYHVVGIVFLCDWASGEVKITDAHTDYKWITVEEAKDYDLIPRMLEQFKTAEEVIKNG